MSHVFTFDAEIAKILGTIKHITANNSESFGKHIAKYIDLKDQKRGDKRDKKVKETAKSLITLLLKDANGKKDVKKDKSEGPAYWPLICQVNVRCNAPALSTGAILVDRPGVMDANTACNTIAKDYMKKCNCIWILAPITHAIDDKTAQGKQPHHQI